MIITMVRSCLFSYISADCGLQELGVQGAPCLTCGCFRQSRSRADMTHKPVNMDWICLQRFLGLCVWPWLG